jgi:hypothetical protein
MAEKIPKLITQLYDVPAPIEGSYLAWGSNGSLVNAAGGTGGGAGGGVAIAAGGSTQTSGTVVFANSNGVTFSSGTQGIFATVATNYQTQGNYLTTAAQSVHTHDYQSTNANYLTVQTVQPVAFSASNGSANFSTLKFVETNGVTFATATDGIRASVNTNYQAPGAYLTTAAQSNHSHGNPTLNLTNLTGTTASGSNGFTLSLSAAAPGGGGGAAISAAGGSQSTGTVIFSNANGVSFGYNAGVITATVQPGAAAGIAAIGASNSTQTSGTVVFANSNGVTFSSGTQGIFATVKTDYQSSNANYLTNQSAQPVAYAAGGTTNAFSTLAFVNSNGVSWSTGTGGIQATVATNYQSQGAYLTTAAQSAHSHGNPTLNLTNLAGTTASASNGFTLSLSATAQTVQPVAYAVGGTTNNFSTLAFANSNGVTFSTGTQGVFATVATNYQSAGAYLTTAAQSGHSHGNPTLALTNLTGTTASNSGGFTLSLSAAAPGAGGGVAIQGSGTYSQSTGTIQFANSNGITFGLSNNGVMTASAAAGAAAGIGAVGAGSQTQTSGTLAFVNSNYMTFGMSNNSQITASYAMSQLTAGANITLSTNGSTMTIIGAAGGGAAYTALTYNNRQLGASTNTVPGNNVAWLAPMRVEAPISASSVMHMISMTGTPTSNQTNTIGVTFEHALYKVTGTNLSRFDTVWTASRGLTLWNSGTVSASYNWGGTTSSSAGTAFLANSIYGLRQMTFAIGSEMGTGLYAWGSRMSSSSAGQSSLMRSCLAIVDNPLPTAMGFMLAATNNSVGYVEGGTYGTTTAAMPASFVFSDIKQTLNAIPYVKIGCV